MRTTRARIPNQTALIAGTRELAISAGVRRHAPRVIAAIDLDDEARARRVEVSDETEQRYLATKCNAELA